MGNNPYIYGSGTRLSNAYKIGRDGKKLPMWAAEKTSVAYKACKTGTKEFKLQARESLAREAGK